MDERDQTLTVTCRPDGEGWRCDVVVGDDAGRTGHEVMVSPAELERYATGAADPTALVRSSFGFLLAREPRESILAWFRLEVIERYYPAFLDEIRKASAERP